MPMNPETVEQAIEQPTTEPTTKLTTQEKIDLRKDKRRALAEQVAEIGAEMDIVADNANKELDPLGIRIAKIRSQREILNTRPESIDVSRKDADEKSRILAKELQKLQEKFDTGKAKAEARLKILRDDRDPLNKEMERLQEEIDTLTLFL